MTPKESYERDFRKAIKISKKYNELRKKKVIDKYARVQISSAPVRGPIPDPVPFEIPPTHEETYLGTLTTIGVNVGSLEAKEASPHLTDSLV